MPCLSLGRTRSRRLARRSKASGALFLGSAAVAALIGALITGGVSYCTSLKIEKVKSEQAVRLDRLQARSKVYRELGNNLGSLGAKLQAFAASAKIAREHQVSARTVAQLKEQLKDAGRAQRAVVATINQQEIHGQPVATEVATCLGEVGQAISAAQADPTAPLDRIESAAAELDELRVRVQNQIEKEIDNVR